MSPSSQDNPAGTTSNLLPQINVDSFEKPLPELPASKESTSSALQPRSGSSKDPFSLMKSPWGSLQRKPAMRQTDSLQRSKSNEGTLVSSPPSASLLRNSSHQPLSDLTAEEHRIFAKMREVYADAMAIEKASERIIETTKRSDVPLFNKSYAERLATAVMSAISIKDDLEASTLAAKFRKRGQDIRNATDKT